MAKSAGAVLWATLSLLSLGTCSATLAIVRSNISLVSFKGEHLSYDGSHSTLTSVSRLSLERFKSDFPGLVGCRETCSCRGISSLLALLKVFFLRIGNEADLLLSAFFCLPNFLALPSKLGWELSLETDFLLIFSNLSDRRNINTRLSSW